MLRLESKILIKGTVKDFLPEDTVVSSQKIFFTKNRKHEHWTTFCESCEQLVQLNAL